MNESMTKTRAARFALAAAVAAAAALPLMSQRLRAQDEPAAGAQDNRVPTSQDEPAAPAQDDQVSPPQHEPAAASAAEAGTAEDTKRAAPAGSAQDVKPTDKAEATAPAGDDPANDKASPVIASAGEIEITAADFATFVSGMPPQDQQQIASQPAVKRQVAEHLVKMKALAREAVKRELDQDPKFREQIGTVRKQLMAQADNARLQMLASALVSTLGADEAADKKYFQDNPDKFGKVQARHILISTRGSNDASNPAPPLTDEQAKRKADEIRARLVNGEDFTALAKAESDDPGSKDTGGTYTISRGQMVPAFEETAYGLKENEISQPVKTQFGYHVIQLQKRLPGTFEEARPSIEALRVETFVRELLGGQPKLDESFFAAAPASPPALTGRQPAGKTGQPAGKTAPKPAEKGAPTGGE